MEGDGVEPEEAGRKRQRLMEEGTSDAEADEMLVDEHGDPMALAESPGAHLHPAPASNGALADCNVTCTLHSPPLRHT